MAESNDVQALSKISSAVDESQIKIILTSQCIKAQSFLVDKLRKQTETQKEIFKHIQNSNSKLEIEIKNAEDEIKSFMLAVNTVKASNVELKKELLLAKESKQDILERVSKGEKKYEALWLQCKARYESLPFVQKWLESSQKLQALKEKVQILNNDADTLSKDIKNKRAVITKTDQQRILTLANFIVIEMPKSVKMIKEKSMGIRELKKKVEEYGKNEIRKSVIVENTQVQAQENKEKAMGENWPNLYRNNKDDTLMMPKLHLNNIDLDCLSAKLDQIKKTDSNSSPLKRCDDVIPQNVNVIKKPRIDSNVNNAYLSSYFKQSIDHYEGSHNKDYSKKKLINILEDVKLDDQDTFKLISKVNPEEFKDVEEIKADDSKAEHKEKKQEVENKKEKNIEAFVEEVDMTINCSSNVLVPPTQFLDLSQEMNVKTPLIQGRSQIVEVQVHRNMENTPEKLKDADYKKKVSFDLPPSLKDIANPPSAIQNDPAINDTTDSQLNVSSVSDSFMNIKNMILKEHNLDLSPQFVYAKNNLNKTNEPPTQPITSKFFKQQEVDAAKDSNINLVKDKDQIDEKMGPVMEVLDIDMKADEVAVSSPKADTSNRAVAGFLFSHGAGALPESLNVSMSTAGYDDQDIDYQCIDSSVLLSPKADLSMPNATDNLEEVTSQEVPNFLSGLRKTGLSFFGKMALDSKPEAGGGQGGFNFNFGSSDDKKTRGGLFSMFR